MVNGARPDGYKALRKRVATLEARTRLLEKLTERLMRDLKLAEAFIDELQATIKRLTKELEGRGK